MITQKYHPKHLMKQPPILRRLFAILMLAALLCTILPMSMIPALAQGDTGRSLEDLAGSSLQSSIYYGDQKTALTGHGTPPTIIIDKNWNAPAFYLEYEFQIADIHNDDGSNGVNFLQPGDAFTVALPTNLLWPTEAMSADMFVTDATVNGGQPFKMATLSAQAGASSATLTFEENEIADGNYYTDLSSLENCSIEFGCALDQSSLGSESGEVVENFPIGTYSVTLKLEANQPKQAPTLTKQGTYLKDSHEIEWAITVTPKGEDYTDAADFVFTDTLTEQSYVTDSFYVNGTQVSPTYDPDTKLLTCAISDALGSGLVIKFKTIPDSSLFAGTSNQITATNSGAALRYSGPQLPFAAEQKGTAPVEIPATWIAKKCTRIANSTGSGPDQIKWTVTVDNCGFTLPNATLHDLLPAGLELAADTVYIGDSMVVTPTLDGDRVFTLPLGSLSEKVQVTYVTSISSDASLSGSALKNTAWLTFDYPYGGGGTITTGKITKDTDVISPLQKTNGGYQSNTHRIQWSVTVNKDKLPLTDLILTDTINGLSKLQSGVFSGAVGPNQRYVEGTLGITTTGGSSPSASWDGDKQTFTVNFGDTLKNQTATITYQTELTDPIDYAYNRSDTTCYDNVSFTAKMDGGADVSKSALSAAKVTSNVLIKSGGSYDMEQKCFTWTFTVNQNKMPMPASENPCIVDTLPAHMTYVAGTAKVGGTAVEPILTMTEDGAQQIVTLPLGGMCNSSQKTAEFKTALDVDAVGWDTKKTPHVPLEQISAMLNEAYLSREGLYDQGPSLTQVTKPSAVIASPVLEKTGSLHRPQNAADDFYVDYAITVNKLGLTLDQFKAESAANTIVDEMSQYLQLDLNTVKLVRGTMDAAGTRFIPDPDGELAKDAYSCQYTSGAEHNTLVVTLPRVPQDATYRLTYRAAVTAAAEGSYALTNNASLNATGTSQSEEKEDIVIDSATAAGQANRLTRLELKKVDARDDHTGLDGAIFAVFNGETRVCQGQTTHGGMITLRFKAASGTEYTLREVGTPTGYSSLPSMDNGIPFTVSSGGLFNWSGVTLPDGCTRVEDGTLMIQNAVNRGEIIFTKVNDLGYTLNGAVFGLYIRGQENQAPITTGTSDETGLVTFQDDVPYGEDYSLKEMTAPRYHILSSQIYHVGIDPDGTPTAITLPDTSDPLQSIVNEAVKGSITIQKTTQNAKPQAGAEFTLTDAFGTIKGVAETGEDGIVIFKDLMLGIAYTLTETKTPAGYYTADPCEITLTDEAGKQDVTVDVVNQPLPTGGWPAPSPAPTASPVPTVSPTPTPTVSPTPTISPTPAVSPTPEGSPPPAESPAARPAPGSTQPPYYAPDLTPEKRQEIDDKLEEARQHPEIIIHDSETLQEEYPTLEIEDLPVPLYSGEGLAVIETPVGELVVIDDSLIPLGDLPLGDLPQTGAVADGGSARTMTSLLLAAAAACLAAAAIQQKRRGEIDE